MRLVTPVAGRPLRGQHRRRGRPRQAVERLGAKLQPLFPIAPEPKSGRRSMVGLYPVAFVGITLAILWRQSGVGATNTIWAEDGSLFYRDAVSQAGISNLVHVYGGYVQLLPRLVFEVIRFVPLRDVASVIAVTGAALVAGLSLIVFRSSAALLRSPIIRGLLVVSMTLLPAAPGELLDNVVNVQWWFVFASFWVLFWRPRSHFGRVAAGTVCLLRGQHQSRHGASLTHFGTSALSVAKAVRELGDHRPPRRARLSAGRGCNVWRLEFLSAGGNGPRFFEGIWSAYRARAGNGRADHKRSLVRSSSAGINSWSRCRWSVDRTRRPPAWATTSTLCAAGHYRSRPFVRCPGVSERCSFDIGGGAGRSHEQVAGGTRSGIGQCGVDGGRRLPASTSWRALACRRVRACVDSGLGP